MMDAATVVRRVRVLTGITRTELAQLAEVSPSTISRIERGELDPRWGTLTQILAATGYQISGDSIVSAGDPSAIAAAKSVLQLVLAEHSTTINPEDVGNESPVEGAFAYELSKLKQALNGEEFMSTRTQSEPNDHGPSEASRWIARWLRVGWLSEQANADAMVTLAISAGNAGKISRRNVARRTVVAVDGWRPLARGIGDAGLEYAVSGLVAARDNRATAASISPVIYVEDPARVVEVLDLEETRAEEGVLLIASTGTELVGAQLEEDVWYVSRAQGVLDAFAGSGREPDKAEDTLRHLLALSA